MLDELAAPGYLSDARYANALVAAEDAARYSKRAIAAIAEGERRRRRRRDGGARRRREIDDHDAMVALWRRRFGAPPANDREKARQVRFLQSRGFALSAIFKLLRDPPADRVTDIPRPPRGQALAGKAVPA